MHIIEVLPLGKGVAHEPLSYFSNDPYDRGAILEIPVRKSVMPAIVLSSQEAFSMKAALRAATFSLRRLPPQQAPGMIPQALITAAEKAADYHATSVGLALANLLPKEVREGTVPFAADPLRGDAIPVHGDKPRVFIAPFSLRATEYVRMVRESFAAQRSILFVAPSLEHVRIFEALFTSGIEDYTITLHSGRSSRALKKAYERLATEVHPLLIIATPQYALSARQDIGTIVLEHERGSGYTGKSRPYLDFRMALGAYGHAIGATVIYADSVPRAEEVEALRTDRALPLTENPSRLELPGVLSVISMEPDSDGKTPFRLFSKKLERAIESAMKSKKHIFLFAARRGLAPLIVCVDCGHIFRDPDSGAPLSLIRTSKDGKEVRTLVSSVTGFHTPAPDTCPHCNSWRLKERGIGIQHVYDELTKMYEARFITLMDHETAKTHKRAAVLRDAFYGNQRGIMLGTALALPYLSRAVDVSAVISMDSLRAIPSWRQEEETMSILCHLREKTRGTVYLQTRADPKDEIFSLANRGAIGTFFDRELEARKAFKYPPYEVFVHLTWREKSAKESSPMRKTVEELFAPYNVSLYSAPHQGEGQGLAHGLMRIPRDGWPHEEIITRLRSLPPSVRVMVNPDRII